MPDEPPAADRRHDAARNPPALVDVGVHLRVVRAGADCVLGGRVEDNHVGVAAHADPSLLRINIEGLCHVRRDHPDKLRRRGEARVDHLVPHHVEPFLHTIHTVGDDTEIVPTELLLLRVEDGVVGAHDTDRTGHEHPLERDAVDVLLADGRRHYELRGNLEVWITDLRLIARDARGDGLADHALAEVPCSRDLLRGAL